MPHSTKRSGKALRERDQAAVLDQIGVEREHVRAAARRAPRAPSRRPPTRLSVWRGSRRGLRMRGSVATGAEAQLGEPRVGGGQQFLEPGRVLLLGRARPSERDRARRPVSAAGPSMKLTPRPLMVSAISTFGPIGHAVELAEHALERVHVVAVAARDVPAEGAQLLAEIAERADLVHPGVGLDLVVVDDRRDLAEAARHRRAQRLPELPFLQLAVAGEHEDAARPAGQPVGQRHALGLGDAHAERAGVGLDVRRLDVRVARQAVQPPQLVERVGGQQAEADEHRVERRRVVPLRREEDVARLVALVEVAHLVEEQPAHDLERAEAGADVAGPGAGNHPERVDARQRREGAHARAARAPARPAGGGTR